MLFIIELLLDHHNVCLVLSLRFIFERVSSMSMLIDTIKMPM